MKVLIVDDEVIIRTGLSTVIDWQGGGFEVLEPADSAEEALSRIPAEKPDIVFTDIRMTGRSGIELAHDIRSAWPDIELIIISGFDEFAYAQQAMREGVSEYLLKTSRPDEVIQAAVRAKTRIDQRRQTEQQEKSQKRAADRELLHRVMTSSLPDEGMVEELLMRYPGFRLHANEQLQAWIITDGRERPDGGQAGRLDALLMQLEQALSALQDGEPGNGCLACELMPWNDAMLLVAKTRRGKKSIVHIQHVIISAGAKQGIQPFIAGGQAVLDAGQLCRSLETAEEAASYAWLLEGQDVILYEDICRRRGCRVLCTLEEEQELAGWLRSGDRQVLQERVSGLVSRVRSDGEATPETAAAYFQSLIVSAHRWLERALRSVGLACEPPVPDPAELSTLAGQPEQVLLEHLGRMMAHYDEQINGAKPVRRAVAFIHEHLDQGLSLQQVARHVHMNPNYFSEMFKRETGQNYIEYVTGVRMRQAMSLLRETPAKISEVAREVGYEDLKYFNRLFKKFTGLTPSEYRAKAEFCPSID